MYDGYNRDVIDIIFLFLLMPVYSFSQINIFQQCPLKYRYQYIDKIKVAQQPQSPHMLLGSAVHWALERLYRQLNQMQIPTREQVIQYVHEYWKKEIDYTQIEFPEDIPESVFLRRWEIYIGEYYDHHAPFGDIKVVLTEWRIVFSLDDAGTLKFRWVIDRLDKQWSTFIINDYKTNKSLPEENKAQYKEQLTLYALGVKEKYGKYYENIKARLHYLHFDAVDEWEVTDELVDGVVEKYTGIVREIEDRRFHANMWAKDRFPAVENPSCRFCAFQSICPVWAHGFMDDEIVVGDTTAKQLVDEYAELAEQATHIKKKKDQLKDILQTYALKKKVEKLFGEAYQVSAKPSVNYSIKDKMGLTHYLTEKWILDEYQDVDRFAVIRGIKSQEIDIEEVKDLIDEKESVTLRVSKKKE